MVRSIVNYEQQLARDQEMLALQYTPPLHVRWRSDTIKAFVRDCDDSSNLCVADIEMLHASDWQRKQKWVSEIEYFKAAGIMHSASFGGDIDDTRHSTIYDIPVPVAIDKRVHVEENDISLHCADGKDSDMGGAVEEKNVRGTYMLSATSYDDEDGFSTAL